MTALPIGFAVEWMKIIRNKAFDAGRAQGREEEVCICAAVKTTDGYIVRGHRHADCIRSIKNMELKMSNSPEAQGFITSRNRYVTREQGRKLQDKAGIPSADKGGYMKGTLFSEDLYRDYEPTPPKEQEAE